MYRAAGRFEKLGEQIKTGSFPRTIRADQCVNLAASNVQLDIIDGDKTFELLGQSRRCQYVVVVGGARHGKF